VSALRSCRWPRTGDCARCPRTNARPRQYRRQSRRRRRHGCRCVCGGGDGAPGAGDGAGSQCPADQVRLPIVADFQAAGVVTAGSQDAEGPATLSMDFPRNMPAAFAGPRRAFPRVLWRAACGHNAGTGADPRRSCAAGREHAVAGSGWAGGSPGGRWRRFGWGMAAIWLVYLALPVSRAWSEVSAVRRYAALTVLVAFAVLFVLTFIGSRRRRFVEPSRGCSPVPSRWCALSAPWRSSSSAVTP
jgi:hypothetical protein